MESSRNTYRKEQAQECHTSATHPRCLCAFETLCDGVLRVLGLNWPAPEHLGLLWSLSTQWLLEELLTAEQLPYLEREAYKVYVTSSGIFTRYL